MKKIIFLMSFICMLNTLSAQSPNSYLKEESSKEISFKNDKKEKMSIAVSGNKSIKQPKLSPKGTYISYVVREYDTSKKVMKMTLKVNSKSGKEIWSIDDAVQKYKWNKNENKIVYISGQKVESTYGLVPEKIIVLNLETHTQDQIELEAKILGTIDVAWGPDGENIYIKTVKKNEVYKYNYNSKKLEKTELISIFISPDGKYTYQKENILANRKFKVQNISSKEILKTDPKLSFKDSTNSYVYGKVVGWSNTNNHVLVFKERIEDVEYVDNVIPANNKHGEIIARNYTKKEITGYVFKYFDIELNKEVYQIEVTGEEIYSFDPLNFTW